MSDFTQQTMTSLKCVHKSAIIEVTGDLNEDEDEEPLDSTWSILLPIYIERLNVNLYNLFNEM